MGNLWLRIKIWTKGILVGLLVIYILLFVSFNQTAVTVWVFPHHTYQSTTLIVAFFAFLTGALVTVLVRTTLVTYRQIRELQDRSRTVKLERTVQELHAKAAKLRARPVAVSAPVTTSATEGAEDEEDEPKK